MKKKNENKAAYKLSYESDHKMGKKKQTHPKGKEAEMFFNITQNSE